MGALVGVCSAVGVLLVCTSLGNRSALAASRARKGALDHLARQSGISQLTGSRLMAVCTCIAVVSCAFAFLLTALLIVALLAGISCGFFPVALIRQRVRRRQQELTKAWPDAVDALLASIRAGYALPESVCALADMGPAALRPAFLEFAGNYRVAGSFEHSMDLLVEELADPIADRVAAALLVAHHVGGHDLGGVLRTLSALLREDARVRGEIEARQSWTVNAARLAVAAPWVTLAMLATRPAALAAYRSMQGAVILLLAAALSLVAYRMMIWIGRLPVESRLAQT